jgi:hypothetical protein
MRKFIIAAALLSTTISYAQSTKKLQKVAATVTAKDLKEKLSVIASAGMEGRETATPGQKRAAAYIENYFKQLGLQPGNGNSYQMQFPVFQDSVTASSLSINGKSFEPYKDYTLSPLSMSTGNWNTDSIVFISFGIVDSTRNDFKSIDIKDKWVIVAEGKAEDAAKPAGAVQYSFRNPASVYVKLVQAKANGAKGLIVVAKDFPKKAAPVKSNMYMKKSQGTNIPMVYVSYNVASALLGRSLQSFADLKNINAAQFTTSVTLSSTTVTNNLESTNVLGVLAWYR